MKRMSLASQLQPGSGCCLCLWHWRKQSSDDTAAPRKPIQQRRSPRCGLVARPLRLCRVEYFPTPMPTTSTPSRSTRTANPRLSADDLRINMWNMERTDLSFNIVDIKPENMEELTEVITASCFHPTHCNLLMYSSSRGCIKLGDMRQRALCDQHSSSLKSPRTPRTAPFSVRSSPPSLMSNSQARTDGTLYHAIFTSGTVHLRKCILFVLFPSFAIFQFSAGGYSRLPMMARSNHPTLLSQSGISTWSLAPFRRSRFMSICAPSCAICTKTTAF